MLNEKILRKNNWLQSYGQRSLSFVSCNTFNCRTTIHMSILMVASVPGECRRCRGTADNINHFESIRQGLRTDDLAMPCRQLHLWALRLGSPGRFSQLSAFRGILLRAGLTPCLIASGRFLLFQSLSSASSSAPPRNILFFYRPHHSRWRNNSVDNKMPSHSGTFHFLNLQENIFLRIFVASLRRIVVLSSLVSRW